MGCGKSAAADDRERYEELCRKHGQEPKITGLYSFDREHAQFVEALELGQSTIEATRAARLREVASKRREVKRLNEEVDSAMRRMGELNREIESLLDELDEGGS